MSALLGIALSIVCCAGSIGSRSWSVAEPRWLEVPLVVVMFLLFLPVLGLGSVGLLLAAAFRGD
jgi:hypothetical protein